MEIINYLIDLILKLDNHLFKLILEFGMWIYTILFLIIFIETGLVVMPFLPGDSLLFAAGTFCAGVMNNYGQIAQLNLGIILLSLTLAAILGDATNYYLGRKFGRKFLNMKLNNIHLINPQYIDKTHTFFENHGTKTIIIARFVPIIRTFAPFVAGIGHMTYGKFVRYNIAGGLLWVISLVLLGYFFGNINIIKNNFETVILVIIFLSILPMIIEIVRNKYKKI